MRELAMPALPARCGVELELDRPGTCRARRTRQGSQQSAEPAGRWRGPYLAAERPAALQVVEVPRRGGQAFEGIAHALPIQGPGLAHADCPTLRLALELVQGEKAYAGQGASLRHLAAGQ